MNEQTESRYKTVGVSFHPDLRRRANDRCKELGLAFSRYVTLCVEAELEGRVETLLPEQKGGAAQVTKTREIDLEEAIERAGRYSEMKSLAIDFEHDVEDVLRQAELCYAKAEKVAHLRVDFVITHVDERTGRTVRVGLECSYNIRNRTTVALGQTILLKSLPALDRVVLVVPYLRNFDPHERQTFTANGIIIATPDTLAGEIANVISEEAG